MGEGATVKAQIMPVGSIDAGGTKVQDGSHRAYHCGQCQKKNKIFSNRFRELIYLRFLIFEQVSTDKMSRYCPRHPPA